MLLQLAHDKSSFNSGSFATDRQALLEQLQKPFEDTPLLISALATMKQSLCQQLEEPPIECTCDGNDPAILAPTPATTAAPTAVAGVCLSSASGGGVEWNEPADMLDGVLINPVDRDYRFQNTPDYLIGGKYVGSRPWPNGNAWTWTISYAAPGDLYVFADAGGYNAGVSSVLEADSWEEMPAPGFSRTGHSSNSLKVYRKEFLQGTETTIGPLQGLLVGGVVSNCNEPSALQPSALKPSALQPSALQPYALQPSAFQP